MHTPYGVRGLFSWDFDFRMTTQMKQLRSHPKATPVMLGCAFAINRQYFWNLGAYDDQLLIWNAENYELSFKLWLCGGELLECPCSRVAHVFRRHNEFRKLDGVDFVARNFKRIAEVWMGDWKQFLYRSDVERFEKIDAGDLTKQKEIRKKLNCKPFDYFLHYIAPEILQVLPIPNKDDIAHGVLRTNLNSTNFCITSKTKYDKKTKKLMKTKCFLTEDCDRSPVIPYRSQYFHLTKLKGIEHESVKMCFDRKQFQDTAGYEFKKNRWNYDFVSAILLILSKFLKRKVFYSRKLNKLFIVSRCFALPQTFQVEA